ncbi:MAG: FlgO family outer membrane protein [Thermodesulfovibrionales bacterium]
MMKDVKVWRLLGVLIALSSLMAQPLMAYDKEIKGLALTIGEQIAKAGKRSVAVVDFTDLQGNVTELGRFIAEEFSVALFGTGGVFEVIDRTHLKSILQEHKLALTGLIDPSTARKLGQIAGVHTIITGTITPFGDCVRLSAKVLDTETARVIGASSVEIAKTKAIEELLNRGIETGAQAGTTTTTSERPKPPVKAQQMTVVKDFAFDLQSCNLGGGVVTCSLLVTNNATDRMINVGKDAAWGLGPPIMFDNLGNEYHSDNLQLANKRGRYIEKHLLVSGVPTRLVIAFAGVSSEATMISLLSIPVRSEGDATVQFRNIPLSR